MARRIAALLIAGLLLSTVGATTTGEFAISIDNSYDTPTDNVTVEGEQFTVSAVGIADNGEQFTVRVTAPADKEYQINLYTLDQQVQDFRPASGNETVTFDTDLVEPGSYVVAAVDNQEFYAVYPVVVTGYELTVTLPEQVPAGEPFDARVVVRNRSTAATIGSVELAVWNGQTRKRIPLSRVEAGVYETTVQPLDNGTYSVSGAVIAAERIDGEENVLAVSEPTTLVADDSLDEPINGTQGPATGSNVSDGRESEDTSQNDDEVISPNNASTDDGEGAGMGVVGAILAILCLASVLALRGLDLSRR